MTGGLYHERGPERLLAWGVPWELRKQCIGRTDKFPWDQRTRGWALLWLEWVTVGVRLESQAESEGQRGEGLTVGGGGEEGVEG